MINAAQQVSKKLCKTLHIWEDTRCRTLRSETKSRHGHLFFRSRYADLRGRIVHKRTHYTLLVCESAWNGTHRRKQLRAEQDGRKPDLHLIIETHGSRCVLISFKAFHVEILVLGCCLCSGHLSIWRMSQHVITNKGTSVLASFSNLVTTNLKVSRFARAIY